MLKHFFPKTALQSWKTEFQPEIVGVSTPSPITMQVPSNTTNRSPMCFPLYFSKNGLIAQLRVVSRGSLTLYVDNCSSKGCRLGKRLKFACVHNNEYRANVPPAIAKIERKNLDHPARVEPLTKGTGRHKEYLHHCHLQPRWRRYIFKEERVWMSRR